jgi:hypothetical protein
MATTVMTDIVDRTINSLKHLMKGKWDDAMATYQNYPLVKVLTTMSREKSGNQISSRLGIGSEDVDGHHGLYEDKDYDRPEVMDEVFIGWRNLDKGFALDTRELDPRAAPEHVVDDMEVLVNNMWEQIATNIENKGFGVPSSSDKLLPHGIPYWVTWLSTALGDFHGGAATGGGHSDVGGIDPAVVPEYQCYADTYADVTRTDLIAKIIKATRYTNWVPPLQTKGDQKASHAIYAQEATIAANEQQAEFQNDRLGFDTASATNSSMVGRIKMTWARALEDLAASGSLPVYIINHAHLYPCVKTGWMFWGKGSPKQAEKQPTVVLTYRYLMYNWFCTLRNRQAVIAKSAPFGETG